MLEAELRRQSSGTGRARPLEVVPAEVCDHTSEGPGPGEEAAEGVNWMAKDRKATLRSLESTLWTVIPIEGFWQQAI